MIAAQWMPTSPNGASHAPTLVRVRPRSAAPFLTTPTAERDGATSNRVWHSHQVLLEGSFSARRPSSAPAPAANSKSPLHYVRRTEPPALAQGAAEAMLNDRAFRATRCFLPNSKRTPGGQRTLPPGAIALQLSLARSSPRALHHFYLRCRRQPPNKKAPAWRAPPTVDGLTRQRDTT